MLFRKTSWKKCLSLTYSAAIVCTLWSSSLAGESGARKAVPVPSADNCTANHAANPDKKTRLTSEIYFASDLSGQIVGIDHADEIKADGGIDVQRHCSRVFTQSSESAPKVYVESKWSSGNFVISDWRPKQGYALLQKQSGDANNETVLLTLANGQRKVLASTPFSDCPTQILLSASPEGISIALVKIKSDCSSETPAHKVSLQFLRPDGTVKGTIQNFNFVEYPYLSWVSETEAILSDAQNTAAVKVPKN